MAITKQTDLEVDQIGVGVTWGGDGVAMQGGATVQGGRGRGAAEGQSEVRGRCRPSKTAEKDPVPDETAKKRHPMEEVAVKVDMMNHSVACLSCSSSALANDFGHGRVVFASSSSSSSSAFSLCS